jgi:NAD(P)H-dependent FMN reductase
VGQSIDGGNTSGYPAVVDELTQLASIPEMDVTPLQSAEGQAAPATPREPNRNRHP